MSHCPETLIRVATEAARRAGTHAREALGHTRAHIKQGTTGAELVTEADRECQRLIIETLRGHFPDHGFIGEEGASEGGITHAPPTGEDPIWWVIDPIDGTNNFARGLDLFAVSIGVLCEGRPVAGVIYNPITDRLFAGQAGSPPELNGVAQACGAEGIGLFTSVALDSHFGDCPPPWLDTLMRQGRYRALGSASLHLAYVATGAMVGAVIGRPKLWDLAAGAALLDGAGAVLTGWTGQPLWPLDPAAYTGAPLPCVAANPHAHAELLNLMGVPAR